MLGSHRWNGKLDLLNIVMIGIPEKLPEQNEKYELHRLLTALFSTELTINEKIDIVREEYNISTENEFVEEMNVMCNLGQGVLEKGMEKGIEKGIALK